ncbi:hypothetical protein RhiirA1_502506 [Rhizophagus irregularis]|uniref:S-adenosyl-L-methionine-dependent tRNA 4-demethylwyosine synthase n=4 Tax=Rhizophagus irregularis TaxID=588596 RepID=A0A2I1E884_9GLOM|nr:Tyw1p [Rhizophagus irregularis DAOM 197198w]PKC70130.1 hypothetical protein RhiirA1_502506 [Rhizophagus irregularis]GBC49593.1 S-adenosyl-L-methionine-dependent tRNA 4-demethylwyosine synthase-like [Rhizophagus irregularis DAOM 181602=DAOM 197198]PKY18316.1 hypothetical protein RhiirB3_490882 [Rhizophagus irregularis]UZN98788.1 hypothetical protein OCT59_000074 [Rhizophagus irregularis]
MLLRYFESLYLSYQALFWSCLAVGGIVVFYVTLLNSKKKKKQIIEDNKKIRELSAVNKEKTTGKGLRKRFTRSTKKTSNQTCTNDSGEKSACCGNGGVSDCCKNQLSEETYHIITANKSTKISVKIFYATQTRTAKYFAQQLYQSFTKHSNCECSIMDIVEYETEDFLSESAICIFLISTYNVEGPLDWFYKWLEDTRYDFRVDKQALSKMKFAIFGLGDSAYGDQFCIQPRNIDKWLGQLGAKRLYPLGEGDKNSDQEKNFEAWKKSLVDMLFDPSYALNNVSSNLNYDSYSESDSDSDNNNNSDTEMVDVEDIGALAPKLQAARKSKEEEEFVYKNSNGRPKRTLSEQEVPINEPKEMVTPMLRKSLTKQGYKVVGSHSGVKICRWTKSALRGRGSCYKFCFYGIQSHRCLETTPSLACSNKCVFCWRHHTNPVGKEFVWKVDPPEMIFSECLSNHYKMINEMKGIPGIRADRFQEAFNVRHCALSLVGEPILYPHINEFIKLLHDRHISSFMVCNAQHPSRLRALDKVTQLYVSVDASTKESLKKIDRPLFKDFWERFLECLDILSQKGQRTVYRLTLVKDYNTEEIANYVELVRRGKPDFIEVKGVTYCGYGGASKLTMANVPYHNEVISFVKHLNENLGDTYEIATEHSHSCSILIANTKFKINNKWYTWIDYDKFFELLEKGEHFTSLDYIAPTPSWALFGSPEAGFNPEDQRFYRKSKKNNNSVKNGGC